MLTRGTFMKGVGLAVVGLSSGIIFKDVFAAEAPKSSQDQGVHLGNQVPYSMGRNRPTISIPANACDCHHHIYDPVRFSYIPEDTRNQPPATVDVYRMLQKRLGLTRNVIIQPSAYGTDNSCLLDALQQMGANARGVVVIDNNIKDAELEKMHKLGVRGIRFNIATGAANDGDMILRLSQRVNQLGWHVSFWMSADDAVKMEDLLLKLPSTIVFDHRGHIPQPAGIDHPAFQVICNLIDQGRTWVKLSGLYQDSKSGEPTYTDTVKVGETYVKYAPERMVWGSDWPHPSEFSARKPMPNDALLLDLLAEQVPDAAIRNRILVDNPAILYGFSK